MLECSNPTFVRGDVWQLKSAKRNSIILGSNIQTWCQLYRLSNPASHQLMSSVIVVIKLMRLSLHLCS